MLLKLNKLTSTKTLLPLDPYASNIGLCIPPNGVRVDHENLGEWLQGDRIQESPYSISMMQDMFCEPVCVSDMGTDFNNPMATAIRNGYHQNWLLDGLPVASIVENDEVIITRYWQGVPLGWTALYETGLWSYVDHRPERFGQETGVIYNHFNIVIHYHQLDHSRFHITRFLVEPFSIRHEYTVKESIPTITTPIPSCLGRGLHTSYDSIQSIPVQNQTGKVLFTYDVLWVENVDLSWHHRWDIYLNMDDAIPDKIHRVSIANTSVVLLICACVIFRVWRRNISGYARVTSRDDDAPPPPQEPWHLVKNDVFRAPAMPLLLAVGSGTGAQLLTTAFLVIFFAMSGWTNQSHPGAISQSTILVYVFAGFANGYVTVLYYRAFQGKLPWRRLCVVSVAAFPSLGMLVFLGLELIFSAAKSTYAVPLSTVLVLLALWGALALPLALLGGWVARKRAQIRFPTKVHESIRDVPSWTRMDWFWGALFVVFSGTYTFGTMFVELYYILSSAWMGYYYNSFFYMTMVLLVMVIACATTAVLYTYYFVFRKQNHFWWWRTFLFGCLTGLCLFLYSFAYFRQFESNSLSTVLVFFCDMFLTSLALGLALGFVALSSVMWFSRQLYGVFADDSLDDHIEMPESTIHYPQPDDDAEKEAAAGTAEMT